MARMNADYGSELHLLRMLGRHRKYFSLEVCNATGAHDVAWLDFPSAEMRLDKQGKPIWDRRVAAFCSFCLMMILPKRRGALHGLRSGQVQTGKPSPSLTMEPRVNGSWSKQKPISKSCRRAAVPMLIALTSSGKR